MASLNEWRMDRSEMLNYPERFKLTGHAIYPIAILHTKLATIASSIEDESLLGTNKLAVKFPYLHHGAAIRSWWSPQMFKS